MSALRCTTLALRVNKGRLRLNGEFFPKIRAYPFCPNWLVKFPAVIENLRRKILLAPIPL